MISFYPGPSQVHRGVPRLVRQAYKEGVLGANHRSDVFVGLYKKTVALLQQKLDVPGEYAVIFVSSATECWEVIAQSLANKKTLHIYNGAFGEKWMKLTHKITGATRPVLFDPQERLQPQTYTTDTSELICITQNETSNGTEVSNEILARLRQLHPHHLLAVDATSSMAGVYLDFSLADVWFASVQKCFGLPAGMAVMFCSPRAIEAAARVHDERHYNSLWNLYQMAAQWQTTHTPNVMAIYLLHGVLQQVKFIHEQHAITRKRSKEWYHFLEARKEIKPLILDDAVRSKTVMTVAAPPAIMNTVKEEALAADMTLGNGYGPLQENTFRIANFPAHSDRHIQQLKQLLKRW